MGNVRGMRVMEYNPADKVYTYNAYNSLGEHQVALGHVQGNTWTWTAEEKLNGATVSGRYTVTLVSPTSYTFKSEVATPSGGWTYGHGGQSHAPVGTRFTKTHAGPGAVQLRSSVAPEQ